MNGMAQHEHSASSAWPRKTVLLQWLGLLPLLPITTSAAAGLCIGISLLAVMAVSSLALLLLQRTTTAAIRLPVMLLVIAALATCADFALQAWNLSFQQSLALFIPLITSSALLLIHADAGTDALSPASTLRASAQTALLRLSFLLIIGTVREQLGTSPLLLPAGFLLLGLLVTLSGMTGRKPLQLIATETPVTGSKRVRVTGKI